MKQINEHVTSEIDVGLEEAIECYLDKIKNSEIKSTGKGIMDLIREDSVLSRKVNFEEAVLMNPSILADVENGEQILKEIREKHPQPDLDEIDDGLEEAIETYLQTIGIEEKNVKTNTKKKSLELSKKTNN